MNAIPDPDLKAANSTKITYKTFNFQVGFLVDFHASLKLQRIGTLFRKSKMNHCTNTAYFPYFIVRNMVGSEYGKFFSGS